VPFQKDIDGHLGLFGQDVHGPIHPALLSAEEQYQASLHRLAALHADLRLRTRRHKRTSHTMFVSFPQQDGKSCRAGGSCTFSGAHERLALLREVRPERLCIKKTCILPLKDRRGGSLGQWMVFRGNTLASHLVLHYIKAWYPKIMHLSTAGT